MLFIFMPLQVNTKCWGLLPGAPDDVGGSQLGCSSGKHGMGQQRRPTELLDSRVLHFLYFVFFERRISLKNKPMSFLEVWACLSRDAVLTPQGLGGLLLVLPGAKGGDGGNFLLMVLLNAAHCRNHSAQHQKTQGGKPKRSLDLEPPEKGRGSKII